MRKVNSYPSQPELISRRIEIIRMPAKMISMLNANINCGLTLCAGFCWQLYRSSLIHFAFIEVAPPQLFTPLAKGPRCEQLRGATPIQAKRIKLDLVTILMGLSMIKIPLQAFFCLTRFQILIMMKTLNDFSVVGNRSLVVPITSNLTITVQGQHLPMALFQLHTMVMQAFMYE